MTTMTHALAIAALCTAAAPAFAADIPVKARPVAPLAAPAFNWTGIYVGVHGGYAWGTLQSNNDATVDHEPKGFLLGGQVGANWQWNWLVLGAEADLAYSNIDGVDRTTFGAFVADVDSRIKYLGTVRGRAGVAYDRFLVYGTAGYAYSRADGRVRVTLAGLPVVSGTDSVKLSGLVGGGGVEAFITGNVTARLEYLYADFGTSNTAINLGFPFTDTFQTRVHILRGAVNYKF